jgi:hypothetical protein
MKGELIMDVNRQDTKELILIWVILDINMHIFMSFLLLCIAVVLCPSCVSEKVGINQKM